MIWRPNTPSSTWGISIERQFEPVPAVFINRDMLKDIYLNIIRKRLPSHAPRRPLAGERPSRARGRRHRNLRHTGTGIDPTQLSRIFEPFFSTKAPGEGTGLGLAIAQRQLREIGGHIEVASRVGKGTCFALLLPYNREGKGIDMAQYDGKILMIDDEQDLLKLSSSILRREGFAVETRSDAREALALLRDESFDIILLDLHNAPR